MFLKVVAAAVGWACLPVIHYDDRTVGMVRCVVAHVTPQYTYKQRVSPDYWMVFTCKCKQTLLLSDSKQASSMLLTITIPTLRPMQNAANFF